MVSNPDSGVLSNKVVKLIILNFAKDYIQRRSDALSSSALAAVKARNNLFTSQKDKKVCLHSYITSTQLKV